MLQNWFTDLFILNISNEIPITNNLKSVSFRLLHYKNKENDFEIIHIRYNIDVLAITFFFII